MALAGQNQARQMYVGLDYPGHATVTALKAGTNGDLALLSKDGTAIAAGEPFVFLKKNEVGEVISSDTINPSNVLFSRSRAYAAPVLGVATISDIVANVNTLYTVETLISHFGSYSPEDEYIKKAFYQAVTGDTIENIIDGLVQSSARNFLREEPTTRDTTRYRLKSDVYVTIPNNKYFTFEKGTPTGTAEVATVTFTQATDEPVVASTVTLDGEFVIPFSIASGEAIADCALAVAAAVNASTAPYTAAAALGVCTITADYKRAETNAAISVTASNYVADTAPTVATTVPGVDGTTWTFIQTEKNDWVTSSYVVGKKTRTSLNWNMNAVFTTLPTIVNTGGNDGVGTGYQVADMEWYLKGERNDFMREAGYPHNLENSYDAVTSGTYNFVEIGYYDEGRDEAKKSKKGITIAMTVADVTAMNTMITNLNTILGAGSITAL